AFYITAGLGSAFLHTLLNWGSCIPVVGASGAISGVMAAFLLLYPGVRIRMLSLFRGIPLGTVKIQAFIVLGYFFVFDLLDGILPLFDLPASRPGVAVWGHVGGFI